jgi:hypothetical protein
MLLLNFIEASLFIFEILNSHILFIPLLFKEFITVAAVFANEYFDYSDLFDHTIVSSFIFKDFKYFIKCLEGLIACFGIVDFSIDDFLLRYCFVIIILDDEDLLFIINSFLFINSNFI